MQPLIDAWISADMVQLVKAAGYVGIASFVFAESGVLVGLLLPGDSLLFAAGFLASAQWLRLEFLLPVVVCAAIAGDSLGYMSGHKLGTRFLRRGDSRFYRQEYIERTEAFFERYGGKAIILARFVPIVRTLAPILAGIATMRYRTFIAYNMIGGVLWGAGVTLLGYFLGAILPESEKYLLPIMLVIIAVSVTPIAREYYRSRRI